MAVRTHPIYTNFRQGEITPRLFGRMDWERYMNGCVTLENFILQPQGGATRRAGTRFVKEVKSSANSVRLIPFRASDTDHYVIEMGPSYFRFYKNGSRIETEPVPGLGYIPVEIAHPYTTDLWDVHYTQMGPTMIFTSTATGIRKLSRFSDTLWRLSTFVGDPPATVEYGGRTTVTNTLLLSATTGTNVQFDCTDALFLAADVGREILSETHGGRATIVTVDTSNRVHADIDDEFATATVAGGAWHISGSPQAYCTPSADSPMNSIITLTLDAEGFHASDVGKYVLLSGGMVEITAYTSGLVVSGKILRELDGVVAQPTNAWSIEESAWSAYADIGYPATASFFESRLVFGGNRYTPDGVWMSAALDYYDFSLGSTDDAGISVRSGSGDYGAVRWFSPRRNLLMGTSDGEYRLSGGSQGDAALTPTNVLIRSTTPHGSSTIQPIRSEHASLFITENKRLLRELAYAYEVDDYRAPNLFDTSEHLTRTETITDMAYQKPPESVIWCVRSDGQLLGCTYLREQDMIGWHRVVTDGTIEAVCTIPSSDGTTDDVWLIVNRTIGGAAKRYVEYMDALTTLHWENAPGLLTDCAVTYDGIATNTITGLDHLEGETVSIVGDGAVFPPAQVIGGQARLAAGTASKIEAGLPFTSTLQTVRPEIPANGTSQGKPKAWPEIIVRFYNSIGGKVNGEFITTSTPPVLSSLDRKVRTLGWDDDAWITVQQLQPMPMTVLCIFGTLATGEG